MIRTEFYNTYDVMTGVRTYFYCELHGSNPNPLICEFKFSNLFFFFCFQIRIASTLGGFFLMMVLLVLYKSKCKTRSLSDQHLEAVIKAAVDQEEQLAALAKRSSSSSYCSGHGLCRCSPSKMIASPWLEQTWTRGSSLMRDYCRFMGFCPIFRCPAM